MAMGLGTLVGLCLTIVGAEAYLRLRQRRMVMVLAPEEKGILPGIDEQFREVNDVAGKDCRVPLFKELKPFMTGLGLGVVDIYPVYERYLREAGERDSKCLWADPDLSDPHPNALACGLIAAAIRDYLFEHVDPFRRTEPKTADPRGAGSRSPPGRASTQTGSRGSPHPRRVAGPFSRVASGIAGRLDRGATSPARRTSTSAENPGAEEYDG